MEHELISTVTTIGQFPVTMEKIYSSIQVVKNYPKYCTMYKCIVSNKLCRRTQRAHPFVSSPIICTHDNPFPAFSKVALYFLRFLLCNTSEIIAATGTLLEGVVNNLAKLNNPRHILRSFQLVLCHDGGVRPGEG
jgi:hypothetical protein